MSFRKLVLAFLFCAFATPAVAGERNAMFTVITSDSAETQMMALILTMQAVQQQRDARVLLCDAGGDVARTDVEDGPVFEPAGRSPQQMLRGLIKQGVQVDVCAIYLPQRDADESDLIDGVGAAKAPEVGDHMADPDVRYFSF